MNPSRRAVYPGSFDPFHLGHLDLIERLAKMFNELIVLIAESSEKKSLFTVAERKTHLVECLKHLKNVRIDSHDGLTVEYLKKEKAGVIVRGLRAVVDFEYESSMANMNKTLAPEIETMLVFSSPEFYFVSSRGVKEVAKHQGSLSSLVPPYIEKEMQKKGVRE